MASFIVEVYELHMRKQQVNDVESKEEAIAAVLAGDGDDHADDSFEYIEEADLYGMTTEGLDMAALVAAFAEHSVQATYASGGFVPSIRDVYPDDFALENDEDEEEDDEDATA